VSRWGNSDSGKEANGQRRGKQQGTTVSDNGRKTESIRELLSAHYVDAALLWRLERCC
jgi:hypothetical protein